MNDFKGNGALDAAMGGFISEPYFTVAFNDGSGAFHNSHEVSSSEAIRNITGSDFDGDGDIDLCHVADEDILSILLNDGDGIFTEHQIINHSDLNTIAMADYNGDGRIDLASAGWDPGTINVYFNDNPAGIATNESHSQMSFSVSVSPNPFTSIIHINLEDIDMSALGISVTVFDMSGRTVCNLPVCRSNTITWNGENNSGNKVSSGFYYCSVTSDNNTITVPMLYLK